MQDTSFWDVVGWMVGMFFIGMLLWLFISVFTDVFRRPDLSGIAKAGWILLIFVLPLIGPLLYLLFRPAVSEEEREAVRGRTYGAGGPHMRTDDIANAHAMLEAGDLTQAEFDEIKAKALGTG